MIDCVSIVILASKHGFPNDGPFLNTGAGRRVMRERKACDALIVDEAAQAVEAETMRVLLPICGVSNMEAPDWPNRFNGHTQNGAL